MLSNFINLEVNNLKYGALRFKQINFTKFVNRLNKDKPVIRILLVLSPFFSNESDDCIFYDLSFSPLYFTWPTNAASVTVGISVIPKFRISALSKNSPSPPLLAMIFSMTVH